MVKILDEAQLLQHYLTLSLSSMHECPSLLEHAEFAEPVVRRQPSLGLDCLQNRHNPVPTLAAEVLCWKKPEHQ